MSSATVDFARPTGTIKPLHGVNNGPISFGSTLDNSHRYRELGVPYVRLHDTNWPHPREVDVPQVFPDLDADPDDPASYCFGPTDDYLRSILATGAKIIYRLGVSIEHYARKRYTDPPADPAKWARVALGIVRHYSEGWADGIPNAVDYWEIWNEPELGVKMWSGTFEQYLELYRLTAVALKEHNPELRVGGYAAADPNGPSPEQFMAYCRDRGLPMDFFSWHTYAKHPDQYVRNATRIRALLDGHGFAGALSLLTEWNYRPLPWGLLCGRDEFLRREGFERLKSEEGASFVATALVRMQDAPVDIMNYYDGQAMTWFCGLFDYYGVPQKTFYAFKAFRELLAYPERVEATCDDEGLAVLAARSADGREGAVLVANFGALEGEVSLSVKGLPAPGARREILMVDRDHNLEPWTGPGPGAGAFMSDQPRHEQDQAPAAAGADRIELLLRRHSVCLVRVRPDESAGS